MTRRRGPTRNINLTIERCEERALRTLVFVLSGNALSAVGPGALSASAAHVLESAGDQAIQLATPTVNTPRAFYGLAREVRALSHGQTIGIVGFSSGGLLATRLAGVKSLHVAAVLDCYGPPDLRDYFNYHGDDVFASYVEDHAHLTRSVIDLLSGPLDTSAYVVGAFGLQDPNVVASVSTASFDRDIPHGQVYYYDGPHGVAITASIPALQDFLAHV